jgi:hypothetical protein
MGCSHACSRGIVPPKYLKCKSLVVFWCRTGGWPTVAGVAVAPVSEGWSRLLALARSEIGRRRGAKVADRWNLLNQQEIWEIER